MGDRVAQNTLVARGGIELATALRPQAFREQVLQSGVMQVSESIHFGAIVTSRDYVE